MCKLEVYKSIALRIFKMQKQLHLLVNNIFKYFSVLLLLFSLLISFNANKKNNNLENIIRADGLGYYSYLPALFIYNDFSFSFVDNISENHPQIDFGNGFLNDTNKGKVNKYYVGVSLLMLPFFIIAHILALIFGSNPDGYSEWYQMAVLFAGNFYLFLGCYFTKKLLLNVIKNKFYILTILVTIVFGSNLFFYTSNYVSHSHIYSFSAISAFLYFSSKFFETDLKKYLFFLAIILGIIVLLRPTNILVVFVFLFYAKSTQKFSIAFLKHWKSFFLSLFLFLTIILIQPLIYYLQTGSWFVWSYGKEGFNFANPQIFNTLFSYQKGFFVYAPIIFISFFGFYNLWRASRYQFMILFTFVLLSVYIVSSWWCWWYGASLGQRAFVDYYSIFAILFAYLLSSINLNKKSGTLVFCVSLLSVVYSQIQTYQYRKIIIHWEAMNEDKFWFTFLKTNPKYEGLVAVPAFFDGIHPTNIVSILASNNKYVSANKSPFFDVYAMSNLSKEWESFNMIHIKDNKYAFVCDNGNYLSVRLDKGGVINHEAKEMNDWEIFSLIEVEDNLFLIKAANNMFLVREETSLVANTYDQNNAEKFKIEIK